MFFDNNINNKVIYYIRNPGYKSRKVKTKMKDIDGNDRGLWKACQIIGDECKEYRPETGSVKCAFCDHAPMKHVKVSFFTS